MTLEEMRRRKAELGLTNEMLSEASGVPLGTVQKIMSGRSKAPRWETLKKLEGTLGERDIWYMDVIDDPRALEVLRKLPESDSIYQRLARETLPPEMRPAGMLRDGGAAAAYGVKKRPGDYTIQDYFALPQERRAELIDGVFYDLASPTGKHQRVVMMTAIALESYVRQNGGPCRVEIAPRAVRLDMDDKTMVEPDVMVICDRNKIQNAYVEGAPDLVIEVLSPSTMKKDVMLKGRKYQRAGVREYWLIDPEALTIMVFEYEKKAQVTFYSFDDKVPVGIWDGKCEIDFAEIKEDLSIYDKFSDMPRAHKAR